MSGTSAASEPAGARRLSTLGIDEAGRGPILGPMVLAGVRVESVQAARLTRAGVADSKSFGFGPEARAARAALVPLILRLAQATWIEVVSVQVIDRYTERGLLNQLEREIADRIIRRIGVPADRIVCDGERLFAPLGALHARLRAVNRGESAHVAVAAASVLAKVRRDQLFECIARRYIAEFGPIEGGGYLNAATYRFLDAYRARHGHLPPEARRSWGAPKVTDQLGLFPEPGTLASCKIAVVTLPEPE